MAMVAIGCAIRRQHEAISCDISHLNAHRQIEEAHTDWNMLRTMTHFVGNSVILT